MSGPLGVVSAQGGAAENVDYLGENILVDGMLFDDFKRKYRCLAFDAPSLIADAVPMAQQCVHLLAKGGVPRDGSGGWEATRLVQIGKTKVRLKPVALSSRLLLPAGSSLLLLHC